MDKLSLRIIKSLNRKQALEWYARLGLNYPGDADLNYLLGNLRLVKLEYDRINNESTPNALSDSDAESDKDANSDETEQLSVNYEEPVNKTESAAQQTISSSLIDFSSIGVPSSTLPPLPKYPPPPPPLVQSSMTERVPCFQPNVFGGKPNENVQEFFQHYENVAQANNWNDERKKQLLSFYVSGVAKSVLENIIREKGQELTWGTAKQSLISAFSFVQNIQILEMELNTRVQAPGEPTVDYVTDVVRLCSLIDNRMQESRVCGHILKGLNPATLQMISMLDNSTKEMLLKNIEKFEQSSVLMRHRLGVAAPISGQPLPNNSNGELNEKIDQLTQLVNQLKMDSKRDSPYSQSRESRYDREFKHERSRGSSGSRDSRGRYNGTRERSWSRGRDAYSYGRRPPSRERRNYRSPGPPPSRTPTRVRFSDNSRQGFPVAANTSFRNNYHDAANNRPSQPCRHCGKWGHWSQSCWSLNPKN